MLIKDAHNLSIVVPVLFCALTVVQVDQHVGQTLVQSILDVVSGRVLALPILRLLIVATIITAIVVCILIMLGLVGILSILIALAIVMLVLVAMVWLLSIVRLRLLSCVVVLG